MESPGDRLSRSTYLAAAIVVVALLVLAALVLPPMLKTTTTASNTTPSAPSLTECPTTQVPTPWFGTLSSGTSSPVTIYFQLYEFNSTSMLVLNASRILEIYGFLRTGDRFSGNGNFTIVPSRGLISLGGPNNDNEGTVVEYTITARPGASGTYHLNLLGLLLAESFPEACTGGAGEIVAGDGRPNYATPGGCIPNTGTESSGKSFTIPGVNYTVPSGTLYYRIDGVANSTA